MPLNKTYIMANMGFRKIGEFLWDIVEVIVFAIAIFLFIYLLVFQPHKIKGDSMQPNFPNGEYLLTDKVTYRLREPKRGDVVVFEAPGANGEEFIKRIIGLPGEQVNLKDGYVYINGKRLNEAYLKSTLKTTEGNFLSEGEVVIVPADNYIVFGDNRVASSDSRAWGFVAKKKITGRAWFIYWPAKNMGTVKDVNYTFL
jgi:signal peptidase I, bacterial type